MSTDDQKARKSGARQESKLDTKDDEACREAVMQNPQRDYDECRRDALAKRNAPQAKQQSGSY
jgi:hypothetical protein